MFALGARLIGSPVQAEYNDHSFTSEEVTASSYVNYFKYMVSSISYNSLSMACYYGCLDVLKNQIGSLENINGEYGQGYGLLHWAAQGAGLSGSGQADEGVARPRRARRHLSQEVRRTLQGHEPEGAVRLGDHPQARPDHSRRALQRPGSHQPKAPP